MDMQLLGERIRTLRKSKRWTQEEFAAKANISYRVLQNIEKGEKGSNPTVKTLEAIAAPFGLTVLDLFSEGVSRPKISPSELAALIGPALDLAKVSPLRRALVLTFATGEIHHFDSLGAAPDILRSAQGLLKVAR
jgi:transcriptional regulator with XRE-family HTH domain